MPSQPLILDNGAVRHGIFAAPVSEVNYRDADVRTVLNKPASKLQRWSGFNRFQYFGVFGDDLIAGCAFADTRWVGLVFVYVFQPSTGKMEAKTFHLPFAWGLDLTCSPTNGSSEFKRGRNRIIMRYANGKKSLSVSLASGLKMDLSFSDNDYQPLSLCTKAGRTGWVYAQKAAGVKAKGSIHCGLGQFDLAEQNAYAHHDYSAGYMRRETWWNWACFSGELADGRVVGLNISCGVNETSYSENCFWLDGQCLPIGLADFEFERGNADSEWRVFTTDGRLELNFKPLGAHIEKLNAILLASDFSQFFGHFNGHIMLENGEMLEIDDQLGFVEDQFARW